MALIVPTITAENPHVYREQIQRVEKFADRVHIDLMDGVFTPNESISVNQVWLPKGLVSDIHVMFRDPEPVLQQLIEVKPDLIIIPAEAEFDVERTLGLFEDTKTRFGIALLPETSVESLGGLVRNIDHLLVFSGNLGYQGGSHADLDLLKKVFKAKALSPNLEIGWDGGVNDSNVRALAAAGIDVINVGGYIHMAPDAGLAYKTLVELLP